MHRPIACFLDQNEARVQMDLLKTAAIEAELAVKVDRSGGGSFSVCCLVVDAMDESKALDLLDRRMNAEGGVSLVRCPSCGSFHLEYPNRPRSSPSASFVGGVIDKLGEMARLNVKQFHCHNCSLTFPPSDAVTGAGDGAVV